MTAALKNATPPTRAQAEQWILRRKDLERLLGISRSQVYALVAAGKLLKPVPLFGARSVGWLRHEVQDALRSCVELSRNAA